MELDDLEIFYLRRKMDEEVSKRCYYRLPETEDFEAVKETIISHIAY
ncbi:MAG: hypothetical protein GTO02_10195, partial [Candidatus Dadabacteria bacterium]|nr:hypothetical protein [Candidatus Dadabacteria bacterium]